MHQQHAAGLHGAGPVDVGPALSVPLQRWLLHRQLRAQLAPVQRDRPAADVQRVRRVGQRATLSLRLHRRRRVRRPVRSGHDALPGRAESDVQRERRLAEHDNVDDPAPRQPELRHPRGRVDGWTGHSEIGPITAGSGLPAAHTSPNVVWEGDYAYAQDDLFQPVTIPAGATSITLSFYALVSSLEIGAVAYDYMTRHYISNPGGASPVSVVQLSDLTFTPTWTLFSGPISTTYAGRGIEIGFYAENDDLYDTLFLIDFGGADVSPPARP